MPDQVITITIPSDKIAAYLPAFLRAVPNDEVDENSDLVYNDSQWFKEYLRRHVRSKIVEGMKLLYEDQMGSFSADDIT